MSSLENLPPQLSWTLRLEELDALDSAIRALEPVIGTAFATGTRGRVLRGEWLGHAVHPVLTDFVLGSWTSATLLDVVGGKSSRGAAQKLLGASLLAVGPTAWTGWAEWSGSGVRDKRVGLVHAVTNGVAIGLYAASYLSRRRGRHSTGAALGLAGAGVASVGGYLGGHLASARGVGSRHPALADAG